MDLDAFFFQIVNVKEDVNRAVARNELRNVILHVFLDAVGKIAETFGAQFVIPANDLDARALLGGLLNPVSNFRVGGASGYKFLELVVGDAGEVEEHGIHRATGMIFTRGAGQHGAAFVHGARGDDVAGEQFARTARVFLGQVLGEQFDFILSGHGIYFVLLLRLIWVESAALRLAVGAQRDPTRQLWFYLAQAPAMLNVRLISSPTLSS